MGNFPSALGDAAKGRQIPTNRGAMNQRRRALI
jgi:hypothetical protein